MSSPFDPFPGLRPIGFWVDHDQPQLPDPRELVDLAWDGDERERVAAVLGAAATHQPGEGCSLCRICGAPNGFLDLSDGTYVWPEGLAHYVAEHAVRLNADVIADLLDATRPASTPVESQAGHELRMFGTEASEATEPTENPTQSVER